MNKILRHTNDGIYVNVKILPGAKNDRIVGCENERIKICIAAPADRGKANERLINFLAAVLEISKSNISIHRGENARLKTIFISSTELEEVIVKKKLIG